LPRREKIEYRKIPFGQVAGPLLSNFSPALALADLIKAYGALMDSKEKAEHVCHIRYLMGRALEERGGGKIFLDLEIYRAVMAFGKAPDANGSVPLHCRQQVRRILGEWLSHGSQEEWGEVQTRMDEPFCADYLLADLFKALNDERALNKSRRAIYHAIEIGNEEALKSALFEYAADYQGIPEDEKLTNITNAELEWAMDRIWHSMRHPIIPATWYIFRQYALPALREQPFTFI